MESHRITERGARGEPRQVVCLAHAGCGWKRDLAGNTSEKDPIVMALVRQHLAQGGVPAPDMMGHPKRQRA